MLGLKPQLTDRHALWQLEFDFRRRPVSGQRVIDFPARATQLDRQVGLSAGLDRSLCRRA